MKRQQEPSTDPPCKSAIQLIVICIQTLLYAGYVFISILFVQFTLSHLSDIYKYNCSCVEAVSNTLDDVSADFLQAG